MPDSPALPNEWLIDACCSLNLATTGELNAILQTPFAGRQLRWFLPEEVIAEAAFLRRGGTGEDAEARVPCDWESHFAAGVLARTDAQTEAETELFVSLSQVIDSGEAMCLALASQRGWGLVTDDIKAQKWAGEVPYLSTLDLLKNWSDHHQIPASRLGATLHQIRERARYGPPRRHPLRAWWLTNLSARETNSISP